MDADTFGALAAACAPLVDPITARALVQVESGFNPHAIGVVAGSLHREPRHEAEAIVTARVLQQARWNFSVGLAQINVGNFERLGLTLDTAFDPCTNLAAMQSVLAECSSRAPSRQHQKALRQTLSCYYSGNFLTGFRHGYVRRVVDAASQPRQPTFSQPKPKEAP
jgi:type IV secretion system protein VirB1